MKNLFTKTSIMAALLLLALLLGDIHSSRYGLEVSHYHIDLSGEVQQAGEQVPDRASILSSGAARPTGEATRPARDVIGPAPGAIAPSGDATAASGDVTAASGDVTSSSGDTIAASGDATAASGDATLRILQLSDIHDSLFGPANTRLITAVAEEAPDLIFITGDLVNSHDGGDTGLAVDLIRKLVEIAPVYVSLGNQEYDMINNMEIDVVEDYQRAGAVVLDFSYVDVSIRGRDYRIGGIYGYCQTYTFAIEGRRQRESEFLMDFQDTHACRLLLSHMPLCWLESYSLYDWESDVVFSGHVHGGQVRIPFLGGLWAPDQGWLPGRLCGVYTTDYDTWQQSRAYMLRYAAKRKYDVSYYEEHNYYRPGYLVLSRGLGNTDWVPRVNNVPEIVVVDITIAEKE